MFEDDNALDFDIDAIMEGTESTIDMIFDNEDAFDAECEATVISDDIDDMAIEHIIGIDDLVTDDDIEAIDRGTNTESDPIDDDAEAGASDPEIFRLQKDLFQNTLLSDDDIKDLNEGMSIEDFTAKVMQEAEEMPVIDMGQNPVRDEEAPVCGECHHNPCICAKPIEVKVDDKHDHDDDDDEDDHDDDDHDFDLEKDFEKADTDDIEVDLTDLDDEENAPSNVPAGPIQPLNDGKECGSANCSNSDVEDDSKLPFAPSSAEDTELEDTLSKLEDSKGEIEMDKFTEEEMKELENAFAEGYAKRLDELEAKSESSESEEEELTAEEAALVEAFEAGYKAALEEVIDESSEEETDTDSFVEETDDIDEMLNSIQEGLEDIEIENEFEGSSINAEQKDANKDMFAGMEKNVDEPGATSQNDTTLPFENVTVKGFADLEDDSKAAMIK